MIVQCDECNAKFRLDDSKVKEGGTKVRCSKCKHIFIVQKEPAAGEPDFDSFLNGLVPPSPETAGTSVEAVASGEERPAIEGGEPAVPATPAAEAREAAAPPAEKEEFDFGEYAFDAEAGTSPAVPAEAPENDGFNIDVDLGIGATAGGDAGTKEKENVSFEDDAFFFSEEPPAPVAEGVEVAEPGTPSFDYDAFSFAEEPPPSDRGTEGAPETGAPPTDFDAFSFSEEPLPQAEKEGIPHVATSLDYDAFSFDEPPPPITEDAVRAEIVEEKSVAGGTPTLPQGDDEFSAVPPLEFSFEPEAAEPSVAVALPAKGIGEPADFDFGDFEFGEAAPSDKSGDGDQVAVEQEAWQEKKQPSFEGGGGEASSAADVPIFVDESPPLSISSRRRGNSFLPIALIAVFLVLALAGGGFYFFKERPAALNKVGLGFVAQWFGLEKEEGGIAVRNPAAAFMNNKEAGEIFVVNGEAVNNFAKPRASIQVKATLYGPKGEILQQKTAYCGNSLSKEQLTTLPVAELEKVMGNPFGDSLSNLAVQPGKAIPFVVVLAGVPKAAADFGIEVVGSTIASK